MERLTALRSSIQRILYEEIKKERTKGKDNTQSVETMDKCI